MRHNAECDALEPKTIPEIIKEVMTLEEVTVGEMAAPASTTSATTRTESETFRKLIEEVKSRKTMKVIASTAPPATTAIDQAHQMKGITAQETRDCGDPT